MSGNDIWTTVSSVTETVEDTNPAVWYEAAKNATTYETAMRFYNKAEELYKKDESGYISEWFLKEKLYYKFHKKIFKVAFCVFLMLFAWLAYNEYDYRSNEGTEKRRIEWWKIEAENRKIKEIEQKKNDAERRKIEEQQRDIYNQEHTVSRFNEGISNNYYRKRSYYDIMSPDYQKRVGSYEKFKAMCKNISKAAVFYTFVDNWHKISGDEKLD